MREYITCPKCHSSNVYVEKEEAFEWGFQTCFMVCRNCDNSGGAWDMPNDARAEWSNYG